MCVLAASLEISVISNFFCDKQPRNPKWLHAVHVVEDTCHLAPYMCFFFKGVKMKHGQCKSDFIAGQFFCFLSLKWSLHGWIVPPSAIGWQDGF